MTRIDYRNLVIVLATLVIVAALTAAFWAYTQDDVYITYTYSRNLAQGKGFVFNPGEPIQGTTTPLYALLMAGVHLLTPDLLHAGNLISALSLLAAGGLIFSLTRPYLSFYARSAILLTLVTSPLIYVSFGMETLLYTALLMLAFYLWARGQREWAVLVAVALTWTRADGVVLGGALGLLALWEAWALRPSGHVLSRWRTLPWRLAAIYFLGSLIWFAFAWLYFGTPLPNTFSAKQEILHGIQFWVDGWERWRWFYGNNWLSLLAVPLIGLGMWRTWIHSNLRPVVLWAVLYTLGYTVLNVTAFWYYTPLVVTLIVLAGFGGEWIARELLRVGVSRQAVIGGASALVVACSGLAVASALRYAVPPPRVETYRLLGEWIAENTNPEGRLLVGDLGIVGYYAQRHTLDVPGLITPDMFYKQEEYAVAKYKPSYVVTTQYWTWVRLVEQDWFHQYYFPLMQISVVGDDFSPMAVYQRRLPLDTPVRAIQGFDLPLTCIAELAQNEPVPTETQARLLSPAGEVVVEVVQPFLAGQYPAGRAIAPERLIEQVGIPLEVEPGAYAWEMDCHDEMLHGDVTVLPIEQAAGYTPVSNARWDSMARLRGAILPEGAEVWSGGSLALALDWEALGTAGVDYSVFIHLLDSNGLVVAQDDGYPRAGSRPTTAWQAGETIVDVRRVLLPPDLPEGDYRLAVGWYDWHTNERLLLADGTDAIFLPFSVHNRWPDGR